MPMRGNWALAEEAPKIRMAKRMAAAARKSQLPDLA